MELGWKAERAEGHVKMKNGQVKPREGRAISKQGEKAMTWGIASEEHEVSELSWGVLLKRWKGLEFLFLKRTRCDGLVLVGAYSCAQWILGSLSSGSCIGKEGQQTLCLLVLQKVGLGFFWDKMLLDFFSLFVFSVTYFQICFAKRRRKKKKKLITLFLNASQEPPSQIWELLPSPLLLQLALTLSQKQ